MSTLDQDPPQVDFNEPNVQRVLSYSAVTLSDLLKSSSATKTLDPVEFERFNREFAAYVEHLDAVHFFERAGDKQKFLDWWKQNGNSITSKMLLQPEARGANLPSLVVGMYHEVYASEQFRKDQDVFRPFKIAAAIEGASGWF
jgi:hypothetical protein